MLKPRMAEALPYLRRLAIARLRRGDSAPEVADLIGVTVRSIQRWSRISVRLGESGLDPRPRPGRPGKLRQEQAAEVLSWLKSNPCDFGFPTQRWTARRVTELIERELGVQMNRRYVSDWLRRRGITPQIPRRIAAERDETQVRWWRTCLWPRIKKKPATSTPSWFSPMKVGF